MKQRKIYSILSALAVVLVVVCVAATSLSRSSKKNATMVATVTDTSNRLRNAILADANYVAVRTADPNGMCFCVDPAIGYAPPKFLDWVNLPQSWDLRITGMFPSETSVFVFVYNATSQEMGQVNEKIEAIRHLSEIPIRVLEHSVMPPGDTSPIMLRGGMTRD